MQSQTTILISGANGEIGSSLINSLLNQNDEQIKIVAIDLQPIKLTSPKLIAKVGDVTDKLFIQSLENEFSFSAIFHLAAILSTGGESNPLLAHKVNVEGSLNLLELARKQSETKNQSTKFIFPSTIAVYGCKSGAGIAVPEDRCLFPNTIYGANKLYVENLGRYYANFYSSLKADKSSNNTATAKIDFRAIRFAGVLSADTLPSGGTSDYASEMIHAAASNKPYSCFVSPKTTIPFIAMPDAVKALLDIYHAPKGSLSSHVYNIASFSISAEEILAKIEKYFGKVSIDFQINQVRQAIVDSWPKSIDVSLAQKDWGWSPNFNQSSTFLEYLFPKVKLRYQIK